MELWDALKRDIQKATDNEVNKMASGAFKNDIHAYNEAVGYLRAMEDIQHFVSTIVERNRNAFNENVT